MIAIIQKLLKAGILVIGAWALGFILFAATILISRPTSLDQTTDAIVVLTGGSNRVEEGLGLFATGRAAHLFISGVHKDVSKQEIKNLWHGENTFPPCCMTLGYQATSTEQNAAETFEWMQKQNYNSIRLVTSNYHMPRALLELHHALPDIDLYPHPIIQPDMRAFSMAFWHLVFSEYHKSLYRRAVLLFTPHPKALAP